MFSARKRIIKPELLDEQSAGQAEKSLRDLVVINRLLGGHELLRKALRSVAAPGERFTMLDVGAASGDTAALVRSIYPNAEVTSFDYKWEHLGKAAYPKVVGDAFRLPFRERSFDFAFCSLLLHHFQDEQIVELLSSFRRVARRAVISSDLERHLLPYYFLPATRWLFRWHWITLHDGPVSVQAALQKKELERLAAAAGLTNAKVSVHRPAFRLSLIAPV